MIFIKYILIFFVFLACTYIGNTYSKKYVNRVQELEKMQNLLNIFKSKIKFTGLTIQEIFNQIYDDNKDVVGDIFKRARKHMNLALFDWDFNDTYVITRHKVITCIG